VVGSGMHDAQQQLPFQALNNIVRYTTEELLSIATLYATRKVEARPLPVPGSKEVNPSNNKAVPSSIIIQGTKMDTKGGNKRQK
jgi:hypothetical protein